MADTPPEPAPASAPAPTPPPLGQALGRIPSGLFILTARRGDSATGMLASWVQQAGFDPPMLTLALRRDRFLADWLAVGGRFALNQLPAGQKHLIRHFARGFPPDAPAFDGVALHPGDDHPQDGPILADALAYLRCEVAGHLDGPDHRIVLSRIHSGALLKPDAEPMLHVRKSGFHY